MIDWCDYIIGKWVSIAIQRSNAASIQSTFPIDVDTDEFFGAL